MNMQEIKTHIEAARQEIRALCHGKTWRMCIPVQSDDSDWVFVCLLEDALALVAEVERLQELVGEG